MFAAEVGDHQRVVGKIGDADAVHNQIIELGHRGDLIRARCLGLVQPVTHVDAVDADQVGHGRRPPAVRPTVKLRPSMSGFRVPGLHRPALVDGHAASQPTAIHSTSAVAAAAAWLGWSC